MEHIEEFFLPEETQHEIIKSLISLLEGIDINGFRKTFIKRENPCEIFSYSISKTLKEMRGNMSAEELLAYLAAHPMIFTSLCEKRIYIY